MSEGTLSGRVALVTGGTSGLGLAIARAFTERGAHVVVSARDRARGEEAASSLGASFVAGDVSVAGDCKKIVDAAAAEKGRLDILVNNAGVFRAGATVDFDEETWDMVVSTKFKGTFFCTAAALPYMTAQNWGRVINVSANRKPYPGAATYSAANAAAGSMTKSWTLEHAGTGITFNDIQPGLIETPATSFLTDNPVLRASMVTTIPAGRVGDADEIAAAAAFLASDEAKYIQGAEIVVDGGLLLGWTDSSPVDAARTSSEAG
ncbi:MAG TPA: SDR family NAD(P)-dependent oxidoreductase [Solirubrobacteraceae bacterium]|nr:SDR family NAD(P)-dependent oxidoreductase [Solirubrobacteraceae bacterium]